MSKERTKSVLAELPFSNGAVNALIEATIERFISPWLPEGERWRRGGWVYILRRDLIGRSYSLVLHNGIGTTQAHRAPKYQQFSKEKGTRLMKHCRHRSSWQSRNLGQAQYGGAIRAGAYIFSFSGLPEEWDEALMLFVAWRLGKILLEKARAIANAKSLEHLNYLVMNA